MMPLKKIGLLSVAFTFWLLALGVQEPCYSDSLNLGKIELKQDELDKISKIKVHKRLPRPFKDTISPFFKLEKPRREDVIPIPLSAVEAMGTDTLEELKNSMRAINYKTQGEVDKFSCADLFDEYKNIFTLRREYHFYPTEYLEQQIIPREETIRILKEAIEFVNFLKWTILYGVSFDSLENPLDLRDTRNLREVMEFTDAELELIKKAPETLFATSPTQFTASHLFSLVDEGFQLAFSADQKEAILLLTAVAFSKFYEKLEGFSEAETQAANLRACQIINALFGIPSWGHLRTFYSS